MRLTPARSRSLALPALAVAAAWLARAAAAPTISFELSPPNPTAGQSVLLRESSPQGGGGWLWDFGDGISSEAASPSHAWQGPGSYTVRLLSQGASAESEIVVSPSDTLRLNGAHPFEITLQAYPPDGGAPSAGRAVAQTDRYGWFSFPEITFDPDNPEVTVKVLEAADDGHYWIFWSGMTSLDYTLTVREVSTSHVEIYEKKGESACGGWDTRSFAFVPTPTPSGPAATPTPVPTAPPTATPTSQGAATRTPQPWRTATPTLTATPTPTITHTPTITPTPTPAPPPLISLRAIQWQWNFFAPPEICPTSCGSQITLRVGQTYQVWIYNGDAEDVVEAHSMGSISAIGLQGGSLPQGGALPLQTITPMTVGSFAFNCTTFCGFGHDDMLGMIHVVP